MSIDLKALLQDVFPGLQDDAAAELLLLARVKTYPADTLLCVEGAYEDVFYIIGEGEAQVSKHFVADEERVLRVLGPGEFFGEMSIIQNVPRTASVRTLTETTVVEIDKEGFEHVLRRSPSMAMKLVRMTIEHLRNNDRVSIAELQRKNKELEAAYRALAEQERLRSEFLTMLAHELRTPLTSAKGFMQLIQRGMLDGSALRMALDRVSENVERVVTLVNDLLFVQEMELIQPTFRPVAVDEVVKAVVTEYEKRAAENDLRIVTEFAPALPTLQADPEGLARAFRAVLDNAVKFSPDGGQVSVRVQPAGDAIEVVVTDPGVGIPEDFLKNRLFHRFERVESADGRLFGGVGLGLPIAKHLIEQHGGRILVESQQGKGSTFTLRLPLA